MAACQETSNLALLPGDILFGMADARRHLIWRRLHVATTFMSGDFRFGHCQETSGLTKGDHIIQRQETSNLASCQETSDLTSGDFQFGWLPGDIQFDAIQRQETSNLACCQETSDLTRSKDGHLP